MAKFRFETLLSLITTLFFNCFKYASVKRFVDMILSFLALVAVMPLMIIIAIGIKASSAGPILYRARRVGVNRKIFTMYKFRTMHHADRNSSASAITSKNDLRVFTLGVWLRRLKIDELPQLINILKGDMAIVGPRPEDPQIVDRYYIQEYFETFCALPGLASPGSIYNYTHGEQMLSETNTEKDYVEQLLPIKLAFDIIYVREASLVYDLKIILRTIQTIIFIVAGKCQFSDPPEMKKARELLLHFNNNGDEYKNFQSAAVSRVISQIDGKK